MPTLLLLQPRHRLDLRRRDLAHGLAGLVRRDRERAAARVLDRAGVPDDGLVAASVRSGWLLLLETVLETRAWPPGSEVLVSAVTHPEMAALVTAAGLVPVPVELDLDTLLPGEAALQAALTPATRAVLVAQLFGARADLDGLARWCAERDLLLVEDAAQAWAGPGSLRSPADVTLVSFGLLKTATAVGGAVLRVRDPGLLSDLRRNVAGWPVQDRRAYAVRLLRAALLLGLARRPAYGTFLLGCRLLRRDADAVLDVLSRPRGGGTGPAALVDRLRRRPCAPLLALLARRLRDRDPSCARVRARTVVGERLRAGLGPATVPGARVPGRTHWLFPVRAAEPDRLVRRLRDVGVDASGATSNLVALTVVGPGGRADGARGLRPGLPRALRPGARRRPPGAGRGGARGCRSGGGRIVITAEGSAGGPRTRRSPCATRCCCTTPR